MRAVITVIGKDTVGILAKISTECASNGVNIMDVSQTVMQDMFVMTMLADITESTIDCTELADRLTESVSGMGLQIHVMHEDIFNSMHNI
ncbi:MAG: ACT domain-containing protein [Eubacterium sp.]|nr:ACT domain-containing protein [Eubacterium sp.]